MQADRGTHGQQMVTVNGDDDAMCTKEACQFNDNLAGFQAAGVPVIGVSPDDGASHQRFRNKYGLRFPLLTDADHAVMDAWGAWGGAVRPDVSRRPANSTFLLDDQGRVERAWHNVKADGRAANVLRPAPGLTSPPSTPTRRGPRQLGRGRAGPSASWRSPGRRGGPGSRRPGGCRGGGGAGSRGGEGEGGGG